MESPVRDSREEYNGVLNKCVMLHFSAAIFQFLLFVFNLSTSIDHARTQTYATTVMNNDQKLFYSTKKKTNFLLFLNKTKKKKKRKNYRYYLSYITFCIF